MSPFRPIDRQTPDLVPPSVADWRPEAPLARFIVEVVAGLDVSRLERTYRGRGRAASHPAWLLSRLVSGYATGVCSSHRSERATYESLACRFLAAGRHPDPDPLAAFRRRCLAEWADRFVPGRELAQEMTLVKRGTLSLAGTKVHANASRQRALSHGHLAKLETPLKAEVQEGRALAAQADRADVPDGVSLPDERQRREARLTALAPAKAKMEARAQERVEREPAADEARRARREAKAKESGKKPPGKPPPPAASGVPAAEPINLPEDASRLRPVAGGGVEQASTAQAAVASGRRWVGVPAGTQAPNDPEPRVPLLAPRAAVPEAMGEVDQRLADPGFCRARQGAVGEAAGIDPRSAVARDEPHAGWRAFPGARAPA